MNPHLHGSTINPKEITMSGNGARRPRGRPPGAKNKPKPKPKGGDAGIRQVTLQFADGSDILEGISSYAARRRAGVIPVGITGAVANVVLRTFDSTINLPGRYNVISLSGALMIPPGGRDEEFTIMLEGPEGKATRGAVVGPLVAAGEVILSALHFTSVEYYRVPPTRALAPVAEGVKREEGEGVVAAPVDPLQRLVDLAMLEFDSTSSVPPHTHL